MEILFTVKIYGMKSQDTQHIYNTNVARSTATHELGHAFGLDDLSSGTSMMNSNRNRSSLYTPQSIDISRVKSLYN